MQNRTILKLFTLFLFCSWSMTLKAQSCWLEASGTQIVNAETGQPIILRTLNLGNWLLQEGYMLHPQGCEGCPATQWQMKLQYYNEGQSASQVEAFYQAWRDNFITKEDIDYIASLGFNSIRLPMHYELFLTPSQRAVRNNVITDLYYGHDVYKDALRDWYDNNQLFNDTSVDGFQTIDRLLEWCEANGLYVILDLHAAPGGQGSNVDIADTFHANNLWDFPVFQDVTDRLWLRISQRYKDEPRIAFYDLINEPNNVPGGGQTMHPLFQRLITTIRNNGDNHMLMIQGNGWGNNYDYLEPFTFSPNWGLVYNAHRYWIAPEDDWVPDPNPNQINKMINLINFRDAHNVPVWVGETGENTNEWLRQNIAWLEEHNIGWAHWTYKRHDVGENAAIMRLPGSYPADGASVMAEVLENIKFQNAIPNHNTIAVVTELMPDPWTTGCFGGSDPSGPPIGQTIWIQGSNGLFVSSEDGQAPMNCDRMSAQGWEHFTVVDAGGGLIALQGSNGLYVSSENGQSGMMCNRPSIQGWETFQWIDQGNGAFSLLGSNGQYVSSENGQSAMMCNRPTAQGWEVFNWGTSGSARLGKTGEKLNGNNDQLVSIYPNPSHNWVQIDAPGFNRLEVINMTGQVIYNATIFSGSTRITSLSPGAYIVRLSNGEASVAQKLLVE